MGKFTNIEATFLRMRRGIRLGSKIERVTKATGIKRAVEAVHGGPCEGCKSRKAWLDGDKS